MVLDVVFFIIIIFFFSIVCGYGDGGWIWWPAMLGCERKTQRRERQRKREEE